MTALLAWYERHPFVTGFLLLYVLGVVAVLMYAFVVVTFAVFGISGEVPNIPGVGGTVAAYGTFFGILATAVGLIGSAQALWKWWRGSRG